MPNSQEWLSANANRAFPFRSSITDSPLPEGLILDLRLFLSALQEIDAYLSRISYDATADSYYLEFSAGGEVVLDGDISRRNGPISRVNKKTALGSGERVCLFTPGESWDDPSWNGAGDWDIQPTEQQSSFEQSTVLPGPASFRRLLIDDVTDPLSGAQPLDSEVSLIGGYNFGITKLLDGSFELNAGPGLGLGYPPADEEDSDLYVATISGVGPDENGNLQLSAADCLRVFSPLLDELPIPNMQQIASDCAPCCPCSSYRKVSAAITRRSRKIKEQCDRLAEIQSDAATAYQIGVDYIDTHVETAFVGNAAKARDPILGNKTLSFSIQNRAAYPVYAYVAVSFSGTAPGDITLVSPKNAVVLPDAGSFSATVAGDTAALTPLQSNGFGVETFPSNITDEGGMIIRIGYPMQNGLLYPIPAASSCVVSLSFDNDVRTDGSAVNIRTICRFGSALSYGRRGHRLTATVSGAGSAHVLTVS
jgi:hypothetical protein